MKVAVCICTYRRPEGLRNLLEHLALIECEHELIIAVADNDYKQQEGIEVVKSMPADYPWKLVSEAVSEQGISYSRNTAARLALAHDPHIVGFLDDDEWPSKRWLSEMLRVQNETDADAVGGPTLPVFPEHATEAHVKMSTLVLISTYPMPAPANSKLPATLSSRHLFYRACHLISSIRSMLFQAEKIWLFLCSSSERARECSGRSMHQFLNPCRWNA